MKPTSKPTERDLEIISKVTAFLYQKGHTKSKVTCDKEHFYRVKDFAIEVTGNDWFESNWYNMNNHMSDRTVMIINRLVDQLKANSKELRITSISRRGFGILFNARKRD